MIKKNLPLIVFTIFVVVFSLWYVEHISLQGGLEYVRNRTELGIIGKTLGSVGFFALALVYARSVLKIIVRTDAFWKRLVPFDADNFNAKKISTKILIFLNKTHTYLGVLAITLIFLHCYLTGSYLDNLLLQIVLVLLAVEGISGFILKLKYTPAELKQKSYLIHHQFLIGIMLVVLTIFGHLILGR
ncbi:MAG: hypothetical protein WC823_00015 [Parcubacteria group bacterium]|jgi:hypothetical protein